MKIGILTCGYVDQALSSEHGQYFDMIKASLAEVNHAFEFVNFNVLERELPSLDEYHGFIVSGSVYNAYDDLPWIHDLMDWIRACEARRKPLVGICFGHQVIARALGGTVEKSPKGWGLGSYEVFVTAQKKWMNLSMDTIRLLVSHQDQVTIVPKGVRVIASNEFCPNFMLVKDNHVLTVQGHPEFSSEFTTKVLEQRKELVTPHHYKDAFKQIDKPQDSVLILHWIDAFFVLGSQKRQADPLDEMTT
ncbi:type 1 glutamine amidotransferase [Vibrio cionasavignyae]|uniref:type 1 glutamine amidotransferase n=1 Tax=Vibrio cionasavignyae TaxID=2910252 RepID=UPI003D1072B1